MFSFLFVNGMFFFVCFLKNVFRYTQTETHIYGVWHRCVIGCLDFCVCFSLKTQGIRELSSRKPFLQVNFRGILQIKLRMEKKPDEHQQNRRCEEPPSSEANIHKKQRKQNAKSNVENSTRRRMQTIKASPGLPEAELNEPHIRAKTFKKWELDCKYVAGAHTTDERNQGLTAVEEPQMYGFSFRVLPWVADVFEERPKVLEPPTGDALPTPHQTSPTVSESRKPEARNEPPDQDQALEAPEEESEAHPGAAMASRPKAEDKLFSEDPTFMLRMCVHAVVKQFFIEADIVFPGMDIKSISRRLFKKVYKKVQDVDLSNNDLYNNLHSSVYSTLIEKWGADNLEQIIINLSNAVTDDAFVSCFTKLLKPKKEPGTVKKLVLNAGQRFKTFWGI